MNRGKLNYFIDMGLAITFLLSFITGIFKFPNLTKYFNIVYRTIPAHNLNKIHDWSGLIMGILVFVHLALHWKWIVVMTKNLFKRKK